MVFGFVFRFETSPSEEGIEISVSVERKLVYNVPMALSAPLIASIVAAVLETVVPSSGALVASRQYESYVAKRILPPEAKVGFMLPPQGDGSIVIDGQTLMLSPVARFRNSRNLIVMPMALQQPSNVVYLNDNFGAVHRVWLISQAEADSIEKN
jgi:hypothetical protein